MLYIPYVLRHQSLNHVTSRMHVLSHLSHLDPELLEESYEEYEELLEQISLEESADEELIEAFVSLGEDDLDYLMFD